MPHLLRIYIAILACVGWAFGDGIVQGKSGIPSIDSLPVHEWDIPTSNNSLPLTLAFSVFPGGGQFYTGHSVRGGFLLAIELGLIYEVFYNKPQQQQRRLDDASPHRDSANYYTRLLLESPSKDSVFDWQKKRSYHAGRVRFFNDKKLTEEDLRRSELAWLVGLHVYGFFDAYGIWKNNQGRSFETRSVSGAAWRAALVPGLGQIYNQEYGKAGLLYMAIIGSVASYQSRQQMVDYYVKRHRTAVREGNTTESSELAEELTFFRKKRNQYIWGLALFYLYSIADASVDAMLSDFDSPVFWALSPDVLNQGVRAEWGIRF